MLFLLKLNDLLSRLAGWRYSKIIQCLFSICKSNDQHLLMSMILNSFVFLTLCWQFQRRPSLPPPEETNVTWEEYIAEPAGNPPCLGRPWITKGSTKSFKATVAMVYNCFILCWIINTWLFFKYYPVHVYWCSVNTMIHCSVLFSE